MKDKVLADILISKLSAEEKEAVSYLRRMVSSYGLQQTQIKMFNFLGDDDKLITDKGEINKTLAELLDSLADDNENSVLHRIHANSAELRTAVSSSYPQLKEDIQKSKDLIKKAHTSVAHYQGQVDAEYRTISQQHKKLNELVDKKDTAFIDDITSTGGGTQLIEQIQRISRGGKFLYTHSSTYSSNHRIIQHHFVLDKEIVLDDNGDYEYNFGKLRIAVSLYKGTNEQLSQGINGTQLDFGKCVKVYGFKDYSETDSHIHPHISTTNTVCWGSAYHDARDAYLKVDLEALLDQMYCLLTQYNDDDPYISLRYFGDDDDEYTTDEYRWDDSSDGVKARREYEAIYTETAVPITEETSDRAELIKSFIMESLELRKNGVKPENGDIILDGETKKFCLVQNMDGSNNATCIQLEDQANVKAMNMVTPESTYIVPNEFRDKIVELPKEFTDEHGNVWRIGKDIEREGAGGTKLEGTILYVIPNYVNSKGTTQTIAAIKTNRGRITYVAPNLNNFPIKEVTK